MKYFYIILFCIVTIPIESYAQQPAASREGVVPHSNPEELKAHLSVGKELIRPGTIKITFIKPVSIPGIVVIESIATPQTNGQKIANALAESVYGFKGEVSAQSVTVTVTRLGKFGLDKAANVVLRIINQYVGPIWIAAYHDSEWDSPKKHHSRLRRRR